MVRKDPYEATASVSVSMRLNLGNYQHADVYAALKDVPFSATPEEIENAVETTVANVAEALVRGVKKRVRMIRDQVKKEEPGQYDAA